MKILITGGCGFIGNNLVRHLLEYGHAISVVDNFSVGRRESLDGLNVTIHAGDIRDIPAWQEHLAGIEAIVHLAAHTEVPASVIDPLHDFAMNVQATVHLLQAAHDYGIPRFIFASSNAPIGEQAPPLHEGLAPHPLSPYGASKLAAEGYCMAWHGSYGMQTVALRFANVYGRYSTHKSSVVARFIKEALRDQQITIYGDGGQTRDLVHVQDIAQGIRLALEAPSIGGEVIQLGTGIETRILDLAYRLKALVPFELGIAFAPPRVGDIYRNFSDITKARQRLGFMPQIALEDGFNDTYTWLIQQQG